MALRDLITEVSPIATLGPVTLAADTNGTGVDLLGYDSATVIIAVGIGGITFSGTNKVEFKLEHSDDNSSFSAVAQSDVISAPGAAITVGTGGIVRTLDAAKAAADTVPTRIGYVGTKRYLRVVADFSGTHGTGTPIYAAVQRGDARLGPV